MKAKIDALLKNTLRITIALLFLAAPTAAVQAQGHDIDAYDAFMGPGPAPDEESIVELRKLFAAERAAYEEKITVRDLRIEAQENDLKHIAMQLEDNTRRIEVCTNLEDLSTRIVCYDNLARALGFKTAQEIKTLEERIAERGFWRVTKRISAVGDEIISVQAEPVEPVMSRSGTRRYPTFNVRCQNGRTDVFLDWKSSLASRITHIDKQALAIKVDNDPTFGQNWDLSEDNFAAFAPRPTEFLQTIRGKDRLSIVITPRHDRTATLIFPLNGFEGALQILIEQCYSL